MGLVGRGTGAEFATDEMAIPVACAVRLSARYWRFSLHCFDVAALDRMARDQDLGSNPKRLLRLADAFRCGARLRIVCAGLARAPRSRSGFSTRTAVACGTLAMAFSARGVTRFHLAMLDSQMG